jgi:beta-N-acetylhexosaminidase
MKTMKSLFVIVTAFVLSACAGSSEGHRSFRSGTPESVGFDSQKLTKIDSIITAAIKDSAFPGVQVCVVKDGLVAFNKSFGRLTYEPRAQVTSLQTMFDIASLTKLIATTTAVMKLYDDRKISLDDKVSKFIPQFAVGKKAEITIKHLLTHSSGLPPFRQLWKFVPDAKYAVDSVYATALVANPGDTTIYSDLGFITLGKIVVQASGKPLDVFVKEEFYAPLGMTRTMFTPPADLWNEVAPTEYDSLWRKKLIQGVVHDENADFLGGVSGHAGLFSTAYDLAALMQMLMNGGEYGGKRYLQPSTVAVFTKRQSEKSTRALGWDTRAASGSSGGNLFSPNSFGHTGFTGTSIWADPERHLFLILLTNRVHPTRANTKIYKVRPAVADAVIEAIVH